MKRKQHHPMQKRVAMNRGEQQREAMDTAEPRVLRGRDAGLPELYDFLTSAL